jgi:hypothetical protein
MLIPYRVWKYVFNAFLNEKKDEKTALLTAWTATVYYYARSIKMKKLVITLSLAIILLSCDNGAMEEDKGPFSLIGEWEATGEFLYEGQKCNYDSSLVFGENDFTELTHVKVENAPIGWTPEFTNKFIGSYIQEENVIRGEWQQVFDDGNKTTLYEYSRPYQFVNKNTLKYVGMQLSVYSNDVTFSRKR